MTTAPELDERYGRGRRSRTSWIVGGAIALVVIVIASWMTVSQSMNAVDADDLSYELVDEHTVTVRFQVMAPQGKDIACAVEALDEEFGVVGWKIVEIPAGDSHMQQLTATIPTVAEATTGLVNSCWAL
ncbi:DUF4307 domain-containing protein [Microbacterium sp.]|uniref:DUF4307 domain-containing protein n=1 Tax=Microbacterium sp. TaxID=51671 RepID=UPI002733BC87|nr:DUF4307 domain-containing protein [Microbacterium sp.]MDP3951172.1 DUF4307 domain-containing protein [Microbacterium sp.]